MASYRRANRTWSSTDGYSSTWESDQPPSDPSIVGEKFAFTVFFLNKHLFFVRVDSSAAIVFTNVIQLRVTYLFYAVHIFKLLLFISFPLTNTIPPFSTFSPFSSSLDIGITLLHLCSVQCTALQRFAIFLPKELEMYYFLFNTRAAKCPHRAVIGEPINGQSDGAKQFDIPQ